MEKSNEITEIFKALALFHVKMDSIKKDATNPFFHSKYASLKNILDAIREPLQECELEFTQFPCEGYGLTTLLVHIPSGEFLQSNYIMQPVKTDPQGAGSVITYQRRYALVSILALNIEDDDDANTGTHGAATPEAAIEAAKLWLNPNTKEFDGAIKKLKAGTTTIQKIRTVMKVSKKVEELLLSAVKGNAQKILPPEGSHDLVIPI
jgi:hypothetical protein